MLLLFSFTQLGQTHPEHPGPPLRSFFTARTYRQRNKRDKVEGSRAPLSSWLFGPKSNKSGSHGRRSGKTDVSTDADETALSSCPRNRRGHRGRVSDKFNQANDNLSACPLPLHRRLFSDLFLHSVGDGCV